MGGRVMAEFFHIGDTIDVASQAGTWHGEVVDVAAEAGKLTVRCIRPPDARDPFGLEPGDRVDVDVNLMARAGDLDGMRADGCDDVDVTGRGRPYHRHAVTGKAHAHPGGDQPHTHQTPEQVAQMSAAATVAELQHIGELAAEAGRVLVAAVGLTPQAPALADGAPDPVEILAEQIRDHFKLDRSGLPDDDDRAVAREMLAALLAGPWHLVLINDPGTARGIVDLEWTP